VVEPPEEAAQRRHLQPLMGASRSLPSHSPEKPARLAVILPARQLDSASGGRGQFP
jgi:hypothetical protein